MDNETPFANIATTAAEPFIYSVEISDSRSTGHFITLYVAGMSPALAPLIDGWKKNDEGLKYHNPELFHRDDKENSWIYKYFENKRVHGWNYHLHWQFDSQPGMAELKKVYAIIKDAIAPGFSDFINQYQVRTDNGS